MKRIRKLKSEPYCVVFSQEVREMNLCTVIRIPCPWFV